MFIAIIWFAAFDSGQKKDANVDKKYLQKSRSFKPASAARLKVPRRQKPRRRPWLNDGSCAAKDRPASLRIDVSNERNCFRRLSRIRESCECFRRSPLGWVCGTTPLPRESVPAPKAAATNLRVRCISSRAKLIGASDLANSLRLRVEGRPF